MTNEKKFKLDELKRLYEPPADPDREPAANFPLQYYEYFLQEIIRLGIKVVTFKDLFNDSDDWDYHGSYGTEYKQWNKKISKNDTYLVIQHDVDNHPFFTDRMIAMEAVYGLRSNVFIFCDRYTKNGPDHTYQIDHGFLVEAQKAGFVIGYHQNAFAMAEFDMDNAIEKYRNDVRSLREIYDIDFVVPHGGIGSVVNGEKIHNVDVPMPDEFKGNLRWVYNRYGVKFDQRWSDGGLRKANDLKKIRRFNIVEEFLHKLKKGTRNFCLIHPQRWGYNVDVEQNTLLAKEHWYRKICLQEYR
ncbi:hypothetical protein N9M01_07380 [Luminiphilus sp.]|nr:hypothetical protein [Luminiphilus sp.]